MSYGNPHNTSVGCRLSQDLRHLALLYKHQPANCFRTQAAPGQELSWMTTFLLPAAFLPRLVESEPVGRIFNSNLKASNMVMTWQAATIKIDAMPLGMVHRHRAFVRSQKSMLDTSGTTYV